MGYFSPHWAKRVRETGTYRIPPMFGVWRANSPNVMVTDPASIQQVFFQKGEVYDKPESDIVAGMTKRMDRLIGLPKGLATSSGSDWARHHKVLSKGFTTGAMSELVPSIVAMTMDLMKRVAGGESVDVNAAMNCLTSDVMGQAMLGLSSEARPKFFAEWDQYVMPCVNCDGDC